MTRRRRFAILSVCTLALLAAATFVGSRGDPTARRRFWVDLRESPLRAYEGRESGPLPALVVSAHKTLPPQKVVRSVRVELRAAPFQRLLAHLGVGRPAVGGWDAMALDRVDASSDWVEFHPTSWGRVVHDENGRPYRTGLAPPDARPDPALAGAWDVRDENGRVPYRARWELREDGTAKVEGSTSQVGWRCSDGLMYLNARGWDGGPMHDPDLEDLIGGHCLGRIGEEGGETVWRAGRAVGRRAR